MDVNMIQQQTSQQQQPTPQQQQSTTQQIQVVRTNQQSPSGRHSKLPDLFLESNNAFDNKIESPSPSNNNHHVNNNNLLIMANEHKEFSCSMSMGDENNLSSSSPVNSTSSSTSVINIINNNTSNVIVVDNNKNKLTTNTTSESDESQPKVSSDNVESKADCKNANITVASNIANAFVNLSNSSSKAIPGTSPAPPAVAAATKNLNVIVTQQQVTQQHLMKTVSFTTSRGIFVPNVIATNIAPQFTIHQYGLHGNNSGPAPNVTVNPNGEFVNSTSGTVRPGNPNHFRLLLQQSPNINFNIINQNPANPSPILEASLQTITKEATLHATKFIPTKTIYPNQIINTRTIVQNQATSTVIKTEEPQHDVASQEASSSSNNNNNDQHIRVLTPSEIMKTLPSLSSQDNNPCFSSSNIEKHENEINRKPLENPTTPSPIITTSGSVASSLQNSNNSSSSITISSCSPLTITTTTTTTSECNNTFSSHFTITTKATAMPSSTPNNAQMIMVRGYINV